MTIEKKKKLGKWSWKSKKLLLIFLIIIISIYFLFFMVNKYYEKRINEAIDENFDIIQIDEGKAPYRKMKSRTEKAYSILLSDEEYEFSAWNKTGEHRQLNISIMGEGTLNLGFMNLNDSSTTIVITGQKDKSENLVINMDINMEGGEVNIEINAPSSTVNIEVSGDGIVRINNISDSEILIIVNGEKIILGPREIYIWEG